MPTDIVPRAMQLELRSEHTVATDFLAAISAHPCETPEDHALLSTLLVDVKARHKEWEEKRTRITQPLLASKRAADELFSPVLAPLKTAEGLLKDKIAAYTVNREAERRQLMAGGCVDVTAMAPVEQTKGVSVREVWGWEVTNEMAVPREYLTVDEEALEDHVDEARHSREAPAPIPGIRFFKCGQVRVRT